VIHAGFGVAIGAGRTGKREATDADSLDSQWRTAIKRSSTDLLRGPAGKQPSPTAITNTGYAPKKIAVVRVCPAGFRRCCWKSIAANGRAPPLLADARGRHPLLAGIQKAYAELR